MAKNSNLGQAKAAKNDEFYTQYEDIQTEVNAYIEYNPDVFRGKTILLPCDDPEWSKFTKFFAQNFEFFGLKKLISTSYAVDSKKYKWYEPTLFETEAPNYDEAKTRSHGKIFVLDHDTNNSGRIDWDDLQWDYLQGDGDFRSKEVTALRDEADIIITNPPFSLFRKFLAWIMEAGKQFAVIGNMNAITYKEVFPLIKDNKIWIDNPFVRGAGYFTSPMELNTSLSYYNSHDYREGFIRVPGVRWFTNIELGRRHEPLQLMSMEDNVKFNKVEYPHYDNYDAIEVSKTMWIPKGYEGIMAVPVSFLDKYCPEQFEILGVTQRNDDPYKIKKYTTAEYKNANDLNARGVIMVDGKPQPMYARILIRQKQ